MKVSNDKDNKKEGGKMKKYIYFLMDYSYLTLTVNNKNEYVRIVHHYPRSNYKSGANRRVYKTPFFILEIGTEYWENKAALFNEELWNKGGFIKMMADDGYSFSVRPKNIPTCVECGIFPVFEHVGYHKSGVKFSQGYDKKCTSCCGLTEEPSPFVSPGISDAIEGLMQIIRETVSGENSLPWDFEVVIDGIPEIDADADSKLINEIEKFLEEEK